MLAGLLAIVLPALAGERLSSLRAAFDGSNQRPHYYHGKRISLNFQNIQTRALLQLIAEVAKKNFLISDAVKGSISLHLQRIPWDEALDLIADKLKGIREQGLKDKSGYPRLAASFGGYGSVFLFFYFHVHKAVLSRKVSSSFFILIS